MFRQIFWSAAVFLLASAPTLADPITVQINTDGAMSEQALGDHVRSALRGAPAEILAIDTASGVVMLEGDATAARALRADPTIASISGPLTSQHNEHRVRLTLDAGLMSVESIASTMATTTPASRRTGWPGEMLRVEMRDASGLVIGERFVPDPRFVRFEGWSDTGTHETGSNRAEIHTGMPVQIQLAVPEGSVTLAVFDQTGTVQHPSDGRLLSQTRLELTEADQ